MHVFMRFGSLAKSEQWPFLPDEITGIDIAIAMNHLTNFIDLRANANIIRPQKQRLPLNMLQSRRQS